MIGGRLLRQAKWHVLHGRVLEWVSIILLFLLIAAPLSILSWLIFATTTFTVQAVTIVDARPSTEAAIRNKTGALLGKNILLLETSILQQSIIDAVPQIRDIRIERKLPSALKIVVQEKSPALLLLSGGKYSFVDSQGVAYEEATLDTLPGVVLPIIKNTGEQTQIRLGLPAVSADFVLFILGAQQRVPDVLGADIAEFRIPSLAAREVHMQLTNNWLVKFDTTRPLDVQIDILQRLLAHTIPPDDHPKIEYIDLRIANRVYYKLRTGAPNKE